MKGLYYILLILTASSGFAQDTLYLDEVDVLGAPISKYAVGARVAHLKNNQTETLDQSLSTENSIYFKTYGNSQLATISFRGTSASHTAVIWNGIPVNSPTLGQTDFSLWPTFLLDNIAVQPGSAGSLYGTGAIGGAVLLEAPDPGFQDTFSFEIYQQLGSFGHWLTGVKGRYGNEKIYGETKVLYKEIENDFDYPLKGTDKTQLQNNAAVVQYGLSQNLYYALSTDQILSFHGMATNNYREIQPAITNNTATDNLEDTNLRLGVSYKQDIGSSRIDGTVAYLVNDQYYNETSRVKSQQFSALIDTEHTLGKKGSVLIGSNFNRFYAETNGYKKEEDRFDIYALFKYRLFPVWSIGLNLRQTFNKRARPFVPSIGQEINVVKTKNHELLIFSQVGWSFRLPTLNDRYWQPGGNPNLNSEESFSSDGGISWKYHGKTLKSSVSATFYKSWVDEWIIWLPDETAVWSPHNIKKVEVTGLELSASLGYTVGSSSFKLSGDYSLTHSKNKSGLAVGDETSIDNQLPYVPEHQINVTFNWQLKSWKIQMVNSYTGLRYTTDDNTAFNSIDAFNLINFRVGREINFKSLKIDLSGEVRNLSNIYYENLKNHAMPGRNYMLNLLFKF